MCFKMVAPSLVMITSPLAVLICLKKRSKSGAREYERASEDEKIEKKNPIVLEKSCGITILSMPLGPNEVRTASLTASGVQGE